MRFPGADVASLLVLALSSGIPLAAQEDGPPPDFPYRLTGVLGSSAVLSPDSGDRKKRVYHEGDSAGDYRLVAIRSDHVEVEKDGRRWRVRIGQGGGGPAGASGIPPYPHGGTREYEAARRALARTMVSLDGRDEPVAQTLSRLEIESGVPIRSTPAAEAILSTREAGPAVATPPVTLAEALRLVLAPLGLEASPASSGILVRAADEKDPQEALERIRAGLDLARAASRRPPEPTPEEKAAAERLAATRVRFDAAGRPLAEVVAWLGGEADLEGGLDPSVRRWAAEEGGLPVAGTFDDVPIEDVLEAILAPKGLVHEVSGTAILVRFRPSSAPVAPPEGEPESKTRLAGGIVPPELAGWTIPALLSRLAAEADVSVRFDEKTLAARPRLREDRNAVALPAGLSAGRAIRGLLDQADLAARLDGSVLFVASRKRLDEPEPLAPDSPLATVIEVDVDDDSFLDTVTAIGQAAGLEVVIDLAVLDFMKERRFDGRVRGPAGEALDGILGPAGLSYTARGRVLHVHPARPNREIGSGAPPEAANPLAGRTIDVLVKNATFLETVIDLARACDLDPQVDLPVLDDFKRRRYTRRFAGPAERVIPEFLASQGLAYEIRGGVLRVHLYDVGPQGQGPLATTRLTLDFDEATFLKVVESIAGAAGLSAVVDEVALEVLPDEGRSRFTFELQDVTASAALGSFLRPLGLGYELRGGTLHVFALAPPGEEDRLLARLSAVPVPAELVGLRLELALAAFSAALGVEIVLSPEGAATYAALGYPLVPNGVGSGPAGEALERLLSRAGLVPDYERDRVVARPPGEEEEEVLPLDRIVDLDLAGAALGPRLADIAREAGLELVPDAEIEPALSSIAPDAARFQAAPLGRVLDEVLDAQGAAWALRGRTVFVFPAPRERDRIERAARRLQEGVDLAAVEAPLADLIRELAARAGLEARIDPAALLALAEKGEARATVGAAGEPLSKALRELLEPRGLDYAVGDGFLFVSTSDAVYEAKVEMARRDVARGEEGGAREKVLAAERDFASDKSPWARFVEEFAKAAGVPVVSSPEVWENHPTVSLAGRFSVRNALARIEDEHGIRGVLLGGTIYFVETR
ncbi:MAG: hypothetical protein HY720_22870 [Planctomycetes bacterium]|nr:hypothetical protein [Planctomycetota bacterium]